MAINKRLLILAALLVSVLAGLAFVPLEAQVEQPINLGSVRVINALVGMGAADVYLNDRLIHMSLPPEQATPYLNLPVGRHRIAVRPPGASPLSVPIADVLIDLSPNQSQTAIVYQKQFAADGYTPPVEQSGAILMLDDNRTPLELGKTRLTAAHLAPGTPRKLSIAYPSRASLLHEIELRKPSARLTWMPTCIR